MEENCFENIAIELALNAAEDIELYKIQYLSFPTKMLLRLRVRHSIKLTEYKIV